MSQEASNRELRVASLFAGVGGIERGLEKAKRFTPAMFCEADPGAVAVLKARFPEVPIEEDVRELDSLPDGIDVLTAGFPCQDLSPVGETRGLRGKKSSLVSHVFRLLARGPVPWVLIENVPFMLQLNRGQAMRYIAGELEKLGYQWAYRVIDTRAFGLPQRRHRVFLLASLEADPSGVLFRRNLSPAEPDNHSGRACGFYWTEGNRGLGWAVDATPTLKGGSSIGIPSAPAIWLPSGRIVTPDIRDAERLQGLPANWTKPAEDAVRPSYRWRLVGNAVTANVATWIGERILSKHHGYTRRVEPLPATGAWPRAAFGNATGRYAAQTTPWPVRRQSESLASFLRFEPKPLSRRATTGFTTRLAASGLKHPREFREDLESHLAAQSDTRPQHRDGRSSTSFSHA